jgi:FtsP/CotA-like multicopper oxidase with cupredoxin domain
VPTSNNQSRSSLGVFASFTSIAAFLFAVIAIIVVNDNTTNVASTASEPVAIAMSEFKFTPSSVTVPVGGSLQITNDGTMAHNLAIEGGPATTDVAPGGSRTLDLSSLPAGTYAFICTIAGHADSGMKGTLTISTSGTATSDSASTDHGEHGADTDWAALDQAMIENTDAYVDAVVASIEAGNPSGVATEGRGNQKLAPTILPDGTKEFTLEASVIDWEVEPGKVVQAWAYNGQVPSPWIRVEPDDHVRVVLTNNLPAGTDIHFHGITTPFTQDGVAPITHPMIMPGETYTYEFYAPAEPELGMYHPHNHGQVAVVNGMFGVFQVGDVGLPRGETINGVTVPVDLQVDQELPMVLNDAGTIGLTLNGKAFPATDPVVSKVGQWTLVHYYNEGLQAHPMHLHHMPQLVVAKDGFPLEQPYFADTVNIAPGERYSVLVQSRPQDVNIDPTDRTTVLGPGIWAYHCHILTHAEGDKGLQGMVTAWVVAP